MCIRDRLIGRAVGRARGRGDTGARHDRVDLRPQPAVLAGEGGRSRDGRGRHHCAVQVVAGDVADLGVGLGRRLHRRVGADDVVVGSDVGAAAAADVGGDRGRAHEDDARLATAANQLLVANR